MLKKLFSISSSFRVLIKTTSNKVAEGLAPLGVLKGGSIFCDNKIQNLLLRLRDVGRFTIGKLEREDTEGPDVDFDVIGAFSSNKLWRHPAYGTNLTVSLGFLLS